MVKEITESKDFDFEAFLAEIGKGVPDMAVIRNGVEKFGMGKLTDEQREQFLKTIFPEENKSFSLGFHNMKAVSNVMAAVAELSQSGELAPEQVKSFLLTQNPNGNGMNIVSTIALNIRAGEFKLDNMQDKVAKASLRENLVDADTALASLGQMDEDIVKEVISTPDNSEKAWSIENLAASNKSKILSKFLEDPKGYLNDGYLSVLYPKDDENSGKDVATDSITVDAEGKTVVGGNDGLNVDGTPKKALNVNAPQNEKDEETQEGDMLPQEGDDKKKKKPFEWEKVKEQDIIQYMFENWFLSGLNGVLKAPFWVMDKCLDALDSKFDASVPKGTKSAEAEKFKSSVKMLNDGGGDIASACMGCLEQQKGYYNALYETIKGNIGRDPEKWDVKNFNGVPVLNSTDEFDRKKMEKFNELSANPDFMKNLEALKEISDEDFKLINRYMQIGARLAVSQYMAANPEGPFDNEAQSKLMKMAMENTDNMMKTVRIINYRVEYNYRAENRIDGPLDDTQKAEVAKRTEDVLVKYIEDVNKRGADLRSSVYGYHKSNLQADKEAKAADMQTKLNLVNGILNFNSDYIESICPSELKKMSNEPITLLDLAHIEIQGDKVKDMFVGINERSAAEINMAKQMIEARKQAYKMNPAYRRMVHSINSFDHKLGRREKEFAEGAKAVGRVVKEVVKDEAKEVAAGVKRKWFGMFGRRI